MTLSKFALAYGECTTEELRRFIKDRTGYAAEELQHYKDLSPRLKRQSPPRRAYLDILSSLDESATFQFQDLLPELRIMVYRNMLVDDRPRRCTNILRASKLIHEEAGDILKKEHLAKLKVTFTAGRTWHYSNRQERDFLSATIYISKRKIFQGETDTKHLPLILTKAFFFMRDVHRLSIEIECIDKVTTYHMASSNIFLDFKAFWPLVQAFLTSTTDAMGNLRFVTVSLTRAHAYLQHHFPPAPELMTCEPLLPLVNLSSDCTLKLCDITEEAEKAFWEAAAASEEDAQAQ